MQVGLSDPNVMFWMQAGAAGDTDRSPLVLGTTTSLAGASGTVLTQMKLDDAARADLVGRLDVLRLSLLLTPTSGGTLFLYSREGDSTKAAKLSFTLCR